MGESKTMKLQIDHREVPGLKDKLHELEIKGSGRHVKADPGNFIEIKKSRWSATEVE